MIGIPIPIGIPTYAYIVADSTGTKRATAPVNLFNGGKSIIERIDSADLVSTPSATAYENCTSTLPHRINILINQ